MASIIRKYILPSVPDKSSFHCVNHKVGLVGPCGHRTKAVEAALVACGGKVEGQAAGGVDAIHGTEDDLTGRTARQGHGVVTHHNRLRQSGETSGFHRANLRTKARRNWRGKGRNLHF